MFKLILRCPASEFTGKLSVKFQTPLLLKGHWEVAVTQLAIDKSTRLLVLCDLVDFTYVGDKRMRLLEYIESYTGFEVYNPPPTYVSVVTNTIESINVDIVSGEQDKLTLNQNKSEILCVLHFRKS